MEKYVVVSGGSNQSVVGGSKVLFFGNGFCVGICSYVLNYILFIVSSRFNKSQQIHYEKVMLRKKYLVYSVFFVDKILTDVFKTSLLNFVQYLQFATHIFSPYF